MVYVFNPDQVLQETGHWIKRTRPLNLNFQDLESKRASARGPFFGPNSDLSSGIIYGQVQGPISQIAGKHKIKEE